MKDTGGQAFPVDTGTAFFAGMTLRDYFAGQALVGLIRMPPEARGLNQEAYSIIIARASYSYANAMITERKK